MYLHVHVQNLPKHRLAHSRVQEYQRSLPCAPPLLLACWSLTTHVIAVGVVHLLHPAVAEGELPHPVHAAMHPCAQAQAGPWCRAVETVRGEVVCAAETRGGGISVGRPRSLGPQRLWGIPGPWTHSGNFSFDFEGGCVLAGAEQSPCFCLWASDCTPRLFGGTITALHAVAKPEKVSVLAPWKSKHQWTVLTEGQSVGNLECDHIGAPLSSLNLNHMPQMYLFTKKFLKMRGISKVVHVSLLNF